METSVAETETNKSTYGKAIVVGLWVVAIYFIWTASSTLLSYAVLYTGSLPLTPEQVQHMQTMPKFLVGFSALLMALNLAGGILLVLRHRSALYVLVLSAVLNVISLAVNIASNGVVPGVSLAQVVIPYAFLVGILMFVFVLYRKRVLWR